MASIIHSSALRSFGLYTDAMDRSKIKEDFKAVKQTGFVNSNALSFMNILSWIPVIGAIIGGIRAYAANLMRKDQSIDPRIVRGMGARAVAEIATLGAIGPVLMIADIAVTVARKFVKEPGQQKPVNTQPSTAQAGTI